ncbi:unnamed protein product [Caenorhabditis bovis]|uniref:Uncharacterized protein n=1 Tax=Caenorhabditis bovis TaxID=2654633 RepID=A0A8S1F2H3_9PELO|nr:unnamed protein product [Caenorhabditis bovis]
MGFTSRLMNTENGVVVGTNSDKSLFFIASCHDGDRDLLDTESKPAMIRPESNKDETRKRFEGFICSSGVLRNGRDDLFISVAYEDIPDVLFPSYLRSDKDRRWYVGKWVSFYLNRTGVLDSFSDVRIIRDVWDTRYCDGLWEVKVPCNFERMRWNNMYKLNSEVFGDIIDVDNVLETENVSSNLHEKQSMIEENITIPPTVEEKESMRSINDTRRKSIIIEEYSIEDDSRSLRNNRTKISSDDESSEAELDMNFERNMKEMRKKTSPLVTKNEENRFDVDNEEEIKQLEIEYDTLIIALFRDMLTSPAVCKSMTEYDNEAFREISKILF